MKKFVFLLLTAFAFNCWSNVNAAQNPTESSLAPIVVTNHTRGTKSGSNHKFEKDITALSNMGYAETYKLYRDEDGNFCVKGKVNRGEYYCTLEFSDKDGYSHKFVDGTTWYCNIYR
ncbi:MAG: hypothetical protein K2M94_01100 [Paramuribaculum sp.]|nr:hypothetical protein [Paramuribaculum sp.]